jgi:septal ring factor EnvC (AmiA/AmiB activator)
MSEMTPARAASEAFWAATRRDHSDRDPDDWPGSAWEWAQSRNTTHAWEAAAQAAIAAYIEANGRDPVDPRPIIEEAVRAGRVPELGAVAYEAAETGALRDKLEAAQAAERETTDHYENVISDYRDALCAMQAERDEARAERDELDAERKEWRVKAVAQRTLLAEILAALEHSRMYGGRAWIADLPSWHERAELPAEASES